MIFLCQSTSPAVSMIWINLLAEIAIRGLFWWCYLTWSDRRLPAGWTLHASEFTVGKLGCSSFCSEYLFDHKITPEPLYNSAPSEYVCPSCRNIGSYGNCWVSLCNKNCNSYSTTSRGSYCWFTWVQLFFCTSPHHLVLFCRVVYPFLLCPCITWRAKQA